MASINLNETINVELGEQSNSLNTTLKDINYIPSYNVELGEQSNSLNTTLKDINYIPSYKEAETKRRANEVVRIASEEQRENYYNQLKSDVASGKYNGKDGAIQYTAGQGIKIENNVISVTGDSGGGTWGSITGTLSDQADLKAALDDKASVSDIPTKVSDLNNDSEFITKTVDNLANYYKKTEIYTQEEVNTLISNVNSFNVEVVQILPTEDIDTHTIYLVPKEAETNDNYDEYIYIDNSWEHIGSTNVDLTNYYNKTEIDTNYYNKTEIDTNHYNKTEIDTKLGEKQEALVSGTNIKTINNNSLLGSGNVDILVNSLSGNEANKAPSVQAVNNKFNELLNAIYPVGSIYMSVNTTNPAYLFGGSWELFSSGTYLIGYDPYNAYFDRPGQDRGSNYVGGNWYTDNTTLTIDQIPSHQHILQGYNGSGSTVTWTDRAVSYGSDSRGYASGVRTSYQGGNQGHNHFHLSPYTIVCIWKRTA